MEDELSPKMEKVVFTIAGIGLLLFIIAFFIDSNEDSQQKMSYTEYKDCRLDTAKWRMVNNNLIDEVCKDFSDGVWDNEPWMGWDGTNRDIDKYVLDNIANPDVRDEISMIRQEVGKTL